MRMSKRADPHGLRSKHRSALRLCLGTAYYSARRYLLWMSGKYRFASQRQKDRLPCVHMAHHTTTKGPLEVHSPLFIRAMR